MIHNLFSPRHSRRQSHDRSPSVFASTSRIAPKQSAFSDGERDRSLFTNCVTQVQRNLKHAVSSPSLLHTLASYYTRREPYVDQRPFCVSLSFSTFLFHMQMSRISLADTDLYVQLVAHILSQITEEEKPSHPFVKMVLNDRIFGIPSPTCAGAAHCVVLAPPHQYRAFSRMVTSLIALNIVPEDTLFQFHQKLYQFCEASSPLVSNRSLTLLIRTVRNVELVEQANALQLVLRAKPMKMNVDFVLACFERLKRIAIDPATGPRFVGALCIHCSEIFLRFRSPIRREYVTGYLYPSLRRYDMEPFLKVPETREHLLRQLLLQCTSGLSPSNPYYLCVAAVVQRRLDDERTGALELVHLLHTQMPQAAYFIAALAVDPQMSVAVFCKIIIILSRGAGHAMVGGEGADHDEVAAVMGDNAGCVYNIIFTLREVIRSCSLLASSSSQASDMLKSLGLALPLTGIERLGRVASEAFDGSRQDVSLEPELLCAEMTMILHHKHLEEAIESSFHFFKDATRQCSSCGLQNSAAFICPVTHSLHLAGQVNASRVLAALAECASSQTLQRCLIRYIQNPEVQMDSALHALLFYILSHAGSSTKSVFDGLEPYIRGTLLGISSMDQMESAAANLGFSAPSSRMTGEQRANVLMLHVRLVCLFPDRISNDYYDSLLTVLSNVPLENNHDMLGLWYMANILVRQSGIHLELLATDPLENNFCIGYPGCAPSSQESALNAQRVLKLLDKAHSFSAESRKLVGCCVCRLIQDFNLQAPNIVGNLLSSFGLVSFSFDSLAYFALPIGEHSTFWSFFLQQMRSSAPARTAFMAALAKSIGRRFRIERPSAAVSIRGLESTGHIFSVWMLEAMKRSPSLSRVTLFMVSNWMKQGGHFPGKFACLVYTCSLLIEAVVSRFEGSSAVDREAETAVDQRIFADAVTKGTTNLEKSLPRLQKLIQVSLRGEENPLFCRLLQRIEKKSIFTVAKVTGRLDDLTEETEEDSDDLQYEMPSSSTVIDGGSDTRHSNQTLQNHLNVEGEEENVTEEDMENHMDEGTVSLSLEELHHNEDDDFFTTFPEREREVNQTEEADRSPYDARPPFQDRTQIYDPTGLQRNTLPFLSSPLSTDEEQEISLKGTLSSPSQESGAVPHRGTGSLPTTGSASPVQPHEALLSTNAKEASDPAKNPPHTATEAVTKNVPSWYEPSMVEWSTNSDEMSPEQKQGVSASVTQEGVPIPSAMALEYLSHHQGMDSLQEEMAQLRGASSVSFTSSSLQHVDQLTREQVVSHFIPTTVLPPASIPSQANSYHQPHATAAASGTSQQLLFPLKHGDATYHTAPQGVTTAALSWAPPLLESSSSHGDGMRVGLMEETIVDGETAILPVSEESLPPQVPYARQERSDDRKRSRFEPSTSIGQNVAASRSLPKGMLYLLQRNHENDAQRSSLLDELRSTVGYTNPSTSSATVAPAAVCSPGECSGVAALAPSTVVNGEHNLQKTPYGQILIPQCLVEQKNDTAMHELRQAMGSRSVNDVGEETGKAGHRRRSKGGSTAERSTSLALWAEMSAVSMPNYVTDLQYSMELF